MPFQITDPSLDAALDRLAAVQPAKVSRTSLATAILRDGLRRCDELDDPEAWRFAAPVSDGAQQNSADALAIREQSDTSPAHPAPSKPEASGDLRSPKQRANAA